MLTADCNMDKITRLSHSDVRKILIFKMLSFLTLIGMLIDFPILYDNIPKKFLSDMKRMFHCILHRKFFFEIPINILRVANLSIS